MTKNASKTEFWEDSVYSNENYLSEELTDSLINSVQLDLGYKLPVSYVALMKSRNGGIPKNRVFLTSTATTWAEDHIEISGIFGIGFKLPYSLGGSLGSRFMISEWGYPEIGIYFADCPSAGHDMLCMDFSDLSFEDEPRIVHIDQENDYKITPLASNFEEFLKGLKPEDVLETDSTDDSEFIWNLDRITAQIIRMPEQAGKGYWLELNQSLKDGETGWMQSRFQVPARWLNSQITITDIGITINDGISNLQFNRHSLGKIRIAVLNDGDLNDDEIEKIWVKSVQDN